jgi:hypothetical protein
VTGHVVVASEMPMLEREGRQYFLVLHRDRGRRETGRLDSTLRPRTGGHGDQRLGSYLNQGASSGSSM